MDFAELESLQRKLAELSEAHVKSLRHYLDRKTFGYRHKYSYSGDEDRDFSKASTATCVLSLVDTGKWDLLKSEDGKGHAPELARRLLGSRWKSANLPDRNPFTVAFLLEAITALEQAERFELPLGRPRGRTVARMIDILVNALKGTGAVHVADYPESAYVTQLVVRALLRRKAMTSALRRKSTAWAKSEMEHQVAMFSVGSKAADVYSLVYATIVFSSLTDSAALTPAQKKLQQVALQLLFKEQLADGTWPRSKPLFYYPKLGNAYCYEYEMLVQLLSPQAGLDELLLEHLPKLAASAGFLKPSAFRLDNAGYGWASDHHPQLQGPESWSTASVFHSVHALNRLVAEAIRRELFRYLDAPYEPPRDPLNGRNRFAAELWDSRFARDGNKYSLKQVVFEQFVAPVAREAHHVRDGQRMAKGTPVSAILFGPPGTSKTDLTKYIAEYLSWPRLMIDPSHLVKNGMDLIQAEANRIFGMLAAAERIVVLLDEFDEMVRDRASGEADLVSRFLTTAMLPKLATINSRRTIVFILATNYIDQFDFAISRHGRFDAILQVMPPSAREKIRNTNGLGQRIRGLRLDADRRAEVASILERLTFGEFVAARDQLGAGVKEKEFMEVLRRADKTCTLNRTTREEEGGRITWAERCTKQQAYIRWTEVAVPQNGGR